MSALSKGLNLPSWMTRGFSGAGSAGPRRLLVIAGTAVAMLGIVVVVSRVSYTASVESTVAKMGRINPLPGGPHGDPAQDALLLKHGEQEAAKAQEMGGSYTPAMPASVPLIVKETAVAPPPLDTPQEVAVAGVKPVPPEPAAYVAPELPLVERVSSTGMEVADAGNDPANRAMIAHLFDGYGGHAPRTDVVLPGAGADVDGGGLDRNVNVTPAADRSVGAPAGVVGGAAAKGHVLIPAGRMIYAHTVLAVDSDTGGPIVLEADTGPLAGDRMLGVFSKNQGERLIVRVTGVEHRGQSLEVRGLVVAPDTMETSVASAVDEHYLERFAFPAAAAFVEGVGQAMAMSGAVTQLSPLGGTATQFGNLNFKQQLGVGAGAAAQQVGTTLQQETPHGPTVKLESNVSVAVMFLADVISPKPF